MMARKIWCICWFSLIISLPCLASSVNETAPSSYMDQKAPGMVPEIFAPGIICLENRYEQYATFTPDGNEFCFSVTNSSWSGSSAFYVKQEQGQWTEPRLADFVDHSDVWCPHFSPDGEGFYLMEKGSTLLPTDKVARLRTSGCAKRRQMDGMLL
jgi:hypothetical protein